MDVGWALPTSLLLLLGALLAAGSAVAAESVDYTRQVKPILKARCYACHGALKRKAGLRLDTGLAIRRGGQSGPALEPGQSDASLVIERVTASDPVERMPPTGSPLGAEQVAVLRAWIDQGAMSPADEVPEADPRRHWSFLPIVRPSVPVVKDSRGLRNPIDAFLEHERRQKGIAPLAAAEPQVLLRRLYLDLIGLPPTREQLHEFLRDPSEAAYAQVVDRLLASPQYGERWARHWMDVWRYSDWYGRRAVPDVLNSYAQIWRWRDWIVRSLNEDKGYDQMVRAMLAADEIAPADDANLVATGFLVRNFYRWNYNSWMKDNVEHTGKAFLGLTFNCAHCHDHKYDPITQEDYFALRAVFEPLELRHDRVPGEPDPGPYPKYEYGKAYRPITSGMVRVFDEKLDAQTFLYTGGESRNIVPGRPPVPPGVPEFLENRSFRVEPVELPAAAAYPGLKPFIQREEVARREAAVREAEPSLVRWQSVAAEADRVLAEAEERHVPGNPRAFADPRCLVLAFPEPAPAAAGLERARQAAAADWLGLEVAEAERAFAVADLAAIRARIAADAADAQWGGSADRFAIARRSAARAEQRAATARAVLELARADRAADAARGKTEADAAKAERFQAAARKALDMARAAIDQDPVTYSPLSPVYPTKSTGRRRALASWITDRANPLAARVAANHIWRWHFGTPLVVTVFDFGHNGAAPTNRALLDWLASELMEPAAPGAAAWSMKALHRQIVLSAAYRMRSHTALADHPGRTIDPENRGYWHFPAARMEAEVVRDSLLHLAGGLDPAMGGPEIDLAQGLSTRRRSLYFTHHGEARMPFLELFDAPDACDAYRRTTTIVPQQALALVNNDMMLALSRELADRLWAATSDGADRGGRGEAFLTAAFEQVLARRPSARERELTRAFLERQAELLGRDGDNAGDAAVRARRDLVHALFSHNDFITIH
jgi:hypothetical protein